jgi:cytochrome c nitrite reductase small subunit
LREQSGQTPLLALGVAAVVGLALGLGTFTFHYAQGTAYLSENPEACVNCHIMQEQFDSWIKSSHQPVTNCNGCHLPKGAVTKWISKADNGFFHSWAFTFRNHPDPIRIKPRNARIVQDNCVSCHLDFVHEMRPADRDGAAGCVHCHKDVGHAAWR